MLKQTNLFLFNLSYPVCTAKQLVLHFVICKLCKRQIERRSAVECSKFFVVIDRRIALCSSMYRPPYTYDRTLSSSSWKLVIVRNVSEWFCNHLYKAAYWIAAWFIGCQPKNEFQNYLPTHQKSKLKNCIKTTTQTKHSLPKGTCCSTEGIRVKSLFETE